MKETPLVSVVGASGYSGAELVSLLSRHPSVRVDKLFANSSAGKRLNEVFPRFSGRLSEIVLEPFTPEAACASDLVMIALPSGEAMQMVPELLRRGKRVIDLGGDFRMKDHAVYETYYKRPHVANELLQEAVYGLPEWNRKTIARARLVANPGCYPTGALLPLLPLLKERIISNRGIIISSLSGVSGAGRSASADLSFTEVNESVKAYKVGVHQHLPEIQSVLESLGSQRVSCTFVPHLLPITRGIYSSMYAPLLRMVSQEELGDCFRTHYGREPFIRILTTGIPEIKHVTFTNYVDIGFRIDEGNNCLILLSVLDNLVKGAAGQAIQNMNIMFGFQETEGLL